MKYLKESWDCVSQSHIKIIGNLVRHPELPLPPTYWFRHSGLHKPPGDWHKLRFEPLEEGCAQPLMLSELSRLRSPQHWHRCPLHAYAPESTSMAACPPQPWGSRHSSSHFPEQQIENKRSELTCPRNLFFTPSLAPSLLLTLTCPGKAFTGSGNSCR